MDCIPHENAPAPLQWIYSWFGFCVYGYADALSIFLGCASIFCWLNAQVPQMLENYKLRSADGLSLYLLYFWLAGDIGNMLSCVLNRQLPFQTYLAAYFILTDLILLYQYFYFGKGDHLCSENALKVPVQSADDEESRYLISDHPLEMTQTIEESSPRLGSYGSTASSKPTVFMGLLLFGCKLGLGSGTNLSTFSPASAATFQITFGWILAWICTSFYLLSRIPQIFKNLKRRSTQGLSLALFAYAVCGNVTYATGILIHPGHTHETIMTSIPYFAGSIGTLLMDMIIFGQFLYYRHNNEKVDNVPATATLTRALTFSSE